MFGSKALDFDSPESLRDLITTAEGRSDPAAKLEVTLARPQRRHLEVSAFAIPGAPDSSMTGLLARDITEQKDLQERRDAFVSIASHELRTPMTTIMGFSELLLDNETLEPSQREWLGRTHQNSRALSAIVDDMLNVSRIQSGRLALDLAHLRLDVVVEEVVADREKLDQVLINLLTNAIKYSPAGGLIAVSARHEERHERIVVEVADQGMGIAPEDREHLFSTFHRIRRPETQGIRGTGLGLSIVSGLVRMMRGEVWVESELDEGSRFIFSLPTRSVEAVDGAWQVASEPARSA